jgi:hypothetical protein
MQPAPKPGDTGRTPVDDAWRQWIAENRLRDCSPDSMIASMVAAGIDATAAATAVTAMEREPAFLAARRHQQLLRKLESVVANQQLLWELAPGYGEIEKRPLCSGAEFVECYAGASRPVVFTDLAADWPASSRWSADDLKQRFGDVQVEVQAAAAQLAGVITAPPRPPLSLAAFIDRLAAGERDLRLVPQQQLLQGRLAALLGDVGTLPDFCASPVLAATATLGIDAEGAATPLQHAAAMSLQVQVVGRSRWRFVSPLQGPLLYNYVGNTSPVDIDQPDFNRYPAFRQARVIEVIVEPGETLFVPLGWWRQVTALTFGVSLALANIDLPNQYHYADPDLRNW